MLVAGCYAEPREGDLHVRRAFDLIAKDQRVRTELSKRTSPATLNDAEATWSLCRHDNRLGPIEHFRHKYTAHLGEPDGDIPLPKYEELFAFAADTTKVMAALAKLTGVKNDDLSDFDDEIAAAAKAFWKPWEAKKDVS